MIWRRFPYRDKNRVLEGFKKDGFDVIKQVSVFNRKGIMAEHKTATNYDTGNKKKAYYVEGTSYQMGYMMGLMAENEISSMTNDFIRRIIPEFINSSSKRNLIEEAILTVVNSLYKKTFNELPYEIREELHGVHEGCKKANPRTKVDMKRLFVLNAGIDILCSMVYSGKIRTLRKEELTPENFRVPVFCNGFSVFGSSAGGGHYFGRDFMFPTAGVFQDVAAHVIYNPVAESRRTPLPFISVTAPGMAGSISAMNIRGVAAGVDMSPAGNCNPSKVGTNSILLTRMAVQYGSSADKAVNIIEKNQRGVSWNYIIADGYKDRACIVEASSTAGEPEYIKYASEDYMDSLPDMEYLKNNESAKFKSGIMVRWNDYKYPAEYLKFNRGLWEKHNREKGINKPFPENVFGEMGYMNKTWNDKNCPSTFYFAPQRENLDDVVLTTNHFIIPEMRLLSMHPWTAKVLGNKVNDIQWRYDELNYQIITGIRKKGYINYDTAKSLIDYLAPYGKHPSYYKNNPKSRDYKELRIEGCVSLFDLKKKTVESHYGYYCDEWVKMTLPYYI